MHKIFKSLIDILKLFMRAGKVLNTVTRVNNITKEWDGDSRKVGSTLRSTTDKVNNLSAQLLVLQNADKEKTDKVNELSAQVLALQNADKVKTDKVKNYCPG